MYFVSVVCVRTVLLFLHTCRYKLCQAQNGSADCGIFALAFASVLASCLHPSTCLFEQQRMHAHFHRCLVDGKMSSEGGTCVFGRNSGK